jgi:predicted DNA-binding protein (MmcQ/YjbR family)
MTAKHPPVALPGSRFAPAVQAHCLAFRGAYEDYPWGDVVYKVGEKMFAAMGGDDDLQVTVKATQNDAEVLTQLPHIRRASYIGRWGWITVSVDGDSTLAQAMELIDASYALVAPKRGKRRSTAD